ncbi:hypothetical protein Aduo_009294 [Ancylostoma duodenale]
MDLANEHSKVLHLTYQCRELRKRAEAQEERADNQRKQRTDDKELFLHKLRKARAEAADRKSDRKSQRRKGFTRGGFSQVAFCGTQPARKGQHYPPRRGVNPLHAHLSRSC